MCKKPHSRESMSQVKQSAVASKQVKSQMYNSGNSGDTSVEKRCFFLQSCALLPKATSCFGYPTEQTSNLDIPKRLK